MRSSTGSSSARAPSAPLTFTTRPSSRMGSARAARTPQRTAKSGPCPCCNGAATTSPGCDAPVRSIVIERWMRVTHQSGSIRKNQVSRNTEFKSVSKYDLVNALITSLPKFLSEGDYELKNDPRVLVDRIEDDAWMNRKIAVCDSCCLRLMDVMMAYVTSPYVLEILKAVRSEPPPPPPKSPLQRTHDDDAPSSSFFITSGDSL